MKTRPFRFGILIFIFSLSAVFNSCDHSYLDIDEIDDYTYSPVFSFPLIHTTLGVDNIFDLYDAQSIEISDDDLVTLVYRGQAYSLEAAELFKIGNQQSDFIFHFMPSKTTPDTKSEVFETFPFIYDGDERIDVIEFKSGVLGINIQADELIQDGYELSITVSIPNSSDDFGKMFSEKFLLQDTPVEFDIDGYTVEFETNDQGDNYFDINYLIEIESHGQPDNAPYDLNFSQSLNNITYFELVGYFDNFDFFVGTENINLGLYSESVLSAIFFKSPYIVLIAENSLGTPLDIHFDRFYFNNNDNDTVQIEGLGFDEVNPWRIFSPDIIGETATTYFEVNRDNINLDELLEISPTSASYHVRGELNPDSDASQHNFLKHNSQFNVDVEVNLPLWGNVERYVFQDTLGFELEGMGEAFNSMEFKFYVENGFPVNLSLQAYFLDKNDVKLDSLFNDKHVKMFQAAKVDENGSVTGITSKSTSILLSPEKFDNINNTKNILLSFSFNTKQEASGDTKDKSDPFSVRIYNDQQVDVKMGVKAKISYVNEF